MFVVVLAPMLASAQDTTSSTQEFSPPPMVPATPPPMPPPEPTSQPQAAPGTNPGTPAPPGTYAPNAPSSGYTYSPYGQGRNAQNKTPPPPEIGLMISETLFGMLSAAGPTVLPYVLLNASSGGFGGDIMGVLVVAIFGLTPIIVAQTQTGIANGSPYYQIDSWIPLLVGLAAQAGVLTAYYFANSYQGHPSFIPPPLFSGASTGGAPPDQGAVVWLFIGSLGIVPILQMAAINIFKQPKKSLFAAWGKPPDKNGFSLGLPTAAPVVSRTQEGVGYGAQLQFLRGTW
ncbi:MAG: hypothetical protein DI536_06850 [Archangium gephyra]|uniref:Uncharacterized protein n=1 Tax=Archangium gephyra TaxID=48 RepID=A0A2W5TMW9_9BACT|nr:MAG: hypothetical protein DI536_06850 [Archangium gephyra]